MFKDAIERLKSRNSKRISDKNKTISKSEPQGGSPDLPALAGEVTELLDSGTVSPETEKVKDWAVSKGISEVDAQDFAEEVISAYFETPSEDQKSDTSVTKSELGTEDEDKDKEKKEKKNPEEEDEEKEKEIEKAGFQFLQKIENLVLALKSDISVLAESLEFVMDQVDKQSSLSREIQRLKSQLGDIANKPASSKTPVTQANPIQVAKTEGLIPFNEREKYGKLILKGIEAGTCQIEDINFFETTGRLSERALAFANEANGVQK